MKFPSEDALFERPFFLVLFALLVGSVLRFIVAAHVGTLADEMLHGPHAINIISSGVINVQNESPAWFYLTDIFYTLFGVGALSARSLSLLYGLLTIPLIYLLGTRLVSRRVGILASIVLAFSAYTARYSLMEMDLAFSFFIFLSFYLFIPHYTEHRPLPLTFFISLGVALLLKPIALPFIAGFGMILFFKKGLHAVWDYIRSQKKAIMLGATVLFFFALPILAYNYILYEQKGITDVIFTRFLKTSPEIYASLQGFDKDFDIAYLFTDGIPFLIYHSFFMLDPFITSLGLLGVLLIFFSPPYRSLRFFLCFFLPPLLFLLGTSLLQTHFVPFMVPLALCAALAIEALAGILERKTSLPYPRLMLLALLFIGTLFLLFPYLQSTSAQFELRSYVSESIKENDIILVDPRIYGGRIAWTFNDRLYVQSLQFVEILTALENTTISHTPRTLYYVECAPDDCGWGTIAQQPQFNASVEQLGNSITQQMELVETIVGGGGYGELEGKPYFKVYKGSASLDVRIDAVIQRTHSWFYYPVRWALPDWYDRYTPQGPFQSLLHFGGMLALWCAIICALIAPFFVGTKFLQNI